jgi:hypothetical protein
MKLLALLLVFALPAAGADVRFDGSYRLRFNTDTNLALDESQFALGQSKWAEHRLRLTPKIVEIGPNGGLEIQASFDLLSGLIGGDTAANFRGYGFSERSEKNGLRASGFDFRHFFAKVRMPVGLLEFGQMPSQWGMGMVANSGDGEEATDFGDPRFGDIVERILFATRPFGALFGPASDLGRQLALAIGGDLVYRDRYAQLVVRNGSGLQWADTAWQILGALVWEPREGSRAGFYVTRRIQTFAARGGDLHIWVFDGHLRHSMPLEALGAVLSLEGEAAEIYGGTSHAPNLSAMGTTRVSQQGAAARAGLAKGQFEAELEGGYASGDANPFDDQATGFQMNRDFKVGLVLFDEVLLFQTQNAARRLSDPGLLGVPPPGLDLLPTEGAVTNALYLKPTLRWKPGFFGGRLRFVGSVLFARAPQPVVDAYQALVSSAPKNAFGHDAGRNYGVELDGAVGYRMKFSGPLAFEAGLQLGYLIPGDAFTRLDGSRMPGAYAMKVRATFLF